MGGNMSSYLCIMRHRAKSLVATDFDCHLTLGKFIFDQTGIVARFNGALAQYSRHIDWFLVPIGYATLRALIEDIRCGEADTFDLICRRFGLSESAAAPVVETAVGKFEWHIGPDAPEETLWHESDLMDDAQKLIRWCAGLADRCPVVVAHQLQMLAAMSRHDLGQYVARTLG